MSVAAVLARTKVIQAGISGIALAYDGTNPPDSIETFPAFLSILDNGTFDYGQGQNLHQYDVRMLLFLRKSAGIGPAVGAAVPFIEATRTAFKADPKLGGAATLARVIAWRLGSYEYAGEAYLGVDFRLRVMDHG